MILYVASGLGSFLFEKIDRNRPQSDKTGQSWPRNFKMLKCGLILAHNFAFGLSGLKLATVDRNQLKSAHLDQIGLCESILVPFISVLLE